MALQKINEMISEDYTGALNARFDSIENELKSGEPIKVTLQNGSNTITTDIAAGAQIEAVQGRTVVNLVPPFMSKAWQLEQRGTIAVVEGARKLTINASHENNHGHITLKVRANKQYTVSATHNGVIGLNYLKADGTVIGSHDYTTAQSISFETPAGTEKLRIWLKAIAGQNVYSFENVQLDESPVPHPFVQGVQGVFNPTIVNETNGTSVTALTTLHNGESLFMEDGTTLYKTAKWGTILLRDLTPLTGAGVGGDYKEVAFANTVAAKNGTGNVNKITKYDGTAIFNRDGLNTAGADEFNTHENGNIYISISNADSGWGDSYAPTLEEVKAYFLGWKMYTNGQNAVDPYNGTGTKMWAKRIVVHDGTGLLDGQSELPTSTHDRYIEPYRLFYELKTPVIETVPTAGALTLDKGENVLQVKAGRVIGEVANPIVYTAGDGQQYAYINLFEDTTRKSHLKYRNNGIAAVYKNGVRMEITKYLNNMAGDGSGASNALNQYELYGKHRVKLPISVYDPTAVYTVDYDVLDEYAVTAPAAGIGMTYQHNLGGVVESLVDETAAAADEIDTLRRNIVMKGEKLEWINLTLQEVSDGWLKYAKDSTGLTHVRLQVNGATWKAGKTIGRLPAGFRPTTNIVLAGNKGNLHPFESLALFAILYNGDVVMAHGTGIADGTQLTAATLISSTIYKAEN